MAQQPIQVLFFLYRPRLQDVCQRCKRSDDKPLCYNYLVSVINVAFLSPADYRFRSSLHRYHLYLSHTLSSFRIRCTDTSCFFPCTVYIFCMSYSSHYARPSALFRRSPAGIPPTAKRFFIDQYWRISRQRIDFAERFRMFFLEPVNRSPRDSTFNQCAPSGQFFQSHYFLLSVV